MTETIGWLVLALSALPVLMALGNVPLFRRLRALPSNANAASLPSASVLIPVRNEAERIGPTLRAVLATERIDFELVVLDDLSTDDTANVVRRYAEADGRVRLIQGEPLPNGWSGKQHACHQLARAARHDVLIWLDADVHVRPNCFARTVRALQHSRAALISGFPHQRTGSWSERLVVPMIHVLLLGYLPIWAMRRFLHPGFAAGCGQFFVADRRAYEAMGGHARIAHSFHDGLTLPRAFRKGGVHTDIFDARDLADCRMYEGLGELWLGFLKNAHEGMAGSVALPVWTLLLVGGHVLPWVLLAELALSMQASIPTAPVLVSCALALGYSTALGVRYRHPWLAILGRPVGVLMLLAIQWNALVRYARGRPTAWRGRVQPTASAPASTLEADTASTPGDET